MNSNSYRFALLIRIVILLIALSVLAFGVSLYNVYAIIGGAVLSLILTINLYRFQLKRIVAVQDFFEAVKYRDFSRWFSTERGAADMRQIHQGFNLVNSTIKTIDKERQAQLLYLQKILEMVNVGIFSYNVESGEVLWANDSVLKMLNMPAFKNISFVEKRKPGIFEELFETYHSNTTSVDINMGADTLKVLITDTVFEMEANSFKLIVIQNIEETLNRNESEAWKKLLSVMTHEIMNSIAPISSLAETLQSDIQNTIENPESNKLALDDINAGLKSIKRRSEGLMKFAKTYRTLNKVTHVNKARIEVETLFESIRELLKPTLEEKAVNIQFELSDPKLIFEIDSYLIEQVLINLLLNAIDATADCHNALISVSAGINTKGVEQIRVFDNGKGIPGDIIDSIFVPFFSTKKTGSGIGLSLSKQIMMLHEGRIKINSEEGKGTEVVLTF